MGMRLQHAEEGLAETHEINVTPFIDVMLVLLVIFMVTAPLATVDVPVNLPASNAAQKPPEDKPVFLTLQADLRIAIGNDRIGREQLASVLDRATAGNRNVQIFLRADKSVEYDHLMDLLNGLRDAGYLKVALVGLGSGAAG
ncbi:TonB system transport protein ExbD [Sphingobium sp. SCG-1]|uniref:TonB system transport protein ExbD n=1 Tax=Sphingobium sp. SCG-1 TaxID=2072936 RepID=UPI000CD69B2E|nr:TonB system transport protein ExbD [Sphingobium sp. SCG-1]AUW59755.1 TonB system transport protein ExbD [Sphingobium sp. SCG-1]